MVAPGRHAAASSGFEGMPPEVEDRFVHTGGERVLQSAPRACRAPRNSRMSSTERSSMET